MTTATETGRASTGGPPVAEQRPGPDGAMLHRASLIGVALLAVLNVADLVTTRLVLHHAGGVEANPAARALLSGHRVEIVKLTILVLLVWRVVRDRASLPWTCLVWLAVGYYTLAVVSNALVLSALP